MANKTVYRCKQGLACTIDGNRYHFSGGDLVLEDHPVNPRKNSNFEEISEYVERVSQPRYRGVVIEQATAEPGAKRARRRRKATKAPEAQPEPETEPETGTEPAPVKTEESKADEA